MFYLSPLIWHKSYNAWLPANKISRKNILIFSLTKLVTTEIGGNLKARKQTTFIYFIISIRLLAQKHQLSHVCT